MTRRKCPRCGRSYVGYPALSRRDNKTEICPDCGTEEALEDFYGNQRRKGFFALIRIPGREKLSATAVYSKEILMQVLDDIRKDYPGMQVEAILPESEFERIPGRKF